MDKKKTMLLFAAFVLTVGLVMPLMAVGNNDEEQAEAYVPYVYEAAVYDVYPAADLTMDEIIIAPVEFLLLFYSVETFTFDYASSEWIL